ncbi:MAG: VCBS repeat-containing protein, partial [Actinobacteria bacterium]|nr:VCBS repeat-containing protein [Actinomycetota bacterium]
MSQRRAASTNDGHVSPLIRFVVLLLMSLLSSRVHGQRLFRDIDVSRVPLEWPATSLRLDDFDRDGRVDVAVTHEAEGKSSVLLSHAGTLFAVRASHEVGLAPIFVESGDFNGDVFPDLVVVNSGSSSVSLLVNRGDGTFADALDVAVDLLPRAIAVGDVDEDGFLDAVSISVVGGRELGVFSVLIGDGAGGLTRTSLVSVGDNPHSLVLRDFDGDAHLDVAVAHTSTIAWFRGRGNGKFEHPLSARDVVTGNPRTIAGADFNRDGLLDLCSTSDSANLVYLEFRPPGGFAPSTISNTGMSGFRAGAFLKPTDFDGDGDLDLLAQTEESNSFGIRFHRGSGNGRFGPAEDVHLDAMATDLGVADVDGDGVLDVVLARSSPAEVAVVRALSPGRLSETMTFPVDEPAEEVFAGDLDGDGAQDLLVRGFQAVHLLQGDGRGGFKAPERLASSELSFDMVVTDLDGRSGAELALVDLPGGRVRILFLDASGRTSRTVERPAQGFPIQIAAADFDGDGLRDLAVTSLSDPSAGILLRPGRGPGGELRFVDVRFGQTAIETVDADRDGHADLLVATREGVSLLFGDGTASFPRRRLLEEYASATTLRVADLDGNGLEDLVVMLQPPGAGVAVHHDVALDGDPRVDVIESEFDVRVIGVYDIDRDGRRDLITGKGT